jgi:hypothetical protein
MIVAVKQGEGRTGRVRQNSVKGDNNFKARLSFQRVFAKKVEKNATQSGLNNARVKSKTNCCLQQAADT